MICEKCGHERERGQYCAPCLTEIHQALQAKYADALLQNDALTKRVAKYSEILDKQNEEFAVAKRLLDEERKSARKKLALVLLGAGGHVTVSTGDTLMDLEKCEIVEYETPYGWRVEVRQAEKPVGVCGSDGATGVCMNRKPCYVHDAEKRVGLCPKCGLGKHDDECDTKGAGSGPHAEGKPQRTVEKPTQPHGDCSSSRPGECIDCGKPVTSGNICVPCVRVRYPNKEDR